MGAPSMQAADLHRTEETSMHTTRSIVLSGLLALAAAGAFADDTRQDRDREGDRAADATHGERIRGALAVVPNGAAANEPGHGWQYFSDAAHRRAVVVSPQGVYFFSRGKGLRQVFPADRQG
jgi:hypothetical protein